MLEGDIVKAFVQQSDGTIKMRPAILVKKLPYFNDWLICGITSQTHTIHKDFDIPILKNHPDSAKTNLPFEMVIRAGWITNFNETKIEGTIGKISKVTLQHLKDSLSRFIRL